MSHKYLISDLHIGHKKILEFSGKLRGDGLLETVDEHDDWLIDGINSVVKKRDTLIILGDICFDKDKYQRLGEINGNKILLKGNHDEKGNEVYEKYFSQIIHFGRLKRLGVWGSHCPMHPNELRGRRNAHGHVHDCSVYDKRYINVCVEACGGLPIDARLIKEGRFETYNKILSREMGIVPRTLANRLRHWRHVQNRKAKRGEM